MQCYRCDSEIPDHVKVCDFCGAHFSNEQRSVTYEDESSIDEADIEEEIVQDDGNLRPVDFGKRLLNFAVDFMVLIALFVLLLVINDSYNFFDFPSIEALNENPEILNEQGNQEEIYLVICTIFILYTFVTEYYFRKTLGKFVTHTKVVSTSGRPLNVGQLLLRAVIKTVALSYEPFVFLASYFIFFKHKALHDQLSKTMVVESND